LGSKYSQGVWKPEVTVVFVGAIGIFSQGSQNLEDALAAIASFRWGAVLMVKNTWAKQVVFSLSFSWQIIDSVVATQMFFIFTPKLGDMIQFD